MVGDPNKLEFVAAVVAGLGLPKRFVEEGFETGAPKRLGLLLPNKPGFEVVADVVARPNTLVLAGAVAEPPKILGLEAVVVA